MTIADVTQPAPPVAAKARGVAPAPSPVGTPPQTHGFKVPGVSARSAPIDKEGLARLLTNAQRGDAQAFAQFYRRTSSLILGAILRIVNGRAEAEDILQDIYMALWQRSVIFDAQRGDVLPWIFTIARHRAINHLRGQKPLVADDALMASLPSDTASPDEISQTRRASRQLSEALSTLSAQQRQAITVAYFGGFSYTELAQVLGVPEGTAKSWIRRGLASLRQMLDR